MALPELQRDLEIRVHVPLSTDVQRNAERVMVEEYLAGVGFMAQDLGFRVRISGRNTRTNVGGRKVSRHPWGGGSFFAPEFPPDFSFETFGRNRVLQERERARETECERERESENFDSLTRVEFRV
jgi:hypothetical protein